MPFLGADDGKATHAYGVDDYRLFFHYQQTQHAFGVDDAKILILFLVLFSEWDAPAKHYWLILA